MSMGTRPRRIRRTSDDGDKRIETEVLEKPKPFGGSAFSCPDQEGDLRVLRPHLRLLRRQQACDASGGTGTDVHEHTGEA